jgi:hypothetical protein
VSYIIGSGWWSAGGDEFDTRRKRHGDASTRRADFHRLWYSAIDRFTDPERIVIVDSASPEKPVLRADDRLVWIELPTNAGHPTNHTGHLSGWTLSVVVGLTYALSSEADHFVYIEQDALVFGDGFVERCIAAMTTPFMFGSGHGTPQPLQQSVFLIRRDGFVPFLARLLSIPDRCQDLSPESKFLWASSRLPLWLLPLARQRTTSRLAQRWMLHFRSFDELPFGPGRARPLDRDAEHFTFQAGEADELAWFNDRFARATGSRS